MPSRIREGEKKKRGEGFSDHWKKLGGQDYVFKVGNVSLGEEGGGKKKKGNEKGAFRWGQPLWGLQFPTKGGKKWRRGYGGRVARVNEFPKVVPHGGGGGNWKEKRNCELEI